MNESVGGGGVGTGNGDVRASVVSGGFSGHGHVDTYRIKKIDISPLDSEKKANVVASQNVDEYNDKFA